MHLGELLCKLFARVTGSTYLALARLEAVLVQPELELERRKLGPERPKLAQVRPKQVQVRILVLERALARPARKGERRGAPQT